MLLLQSALTIYCVILAILLLLKEGKFLLFFNHEIFNLFENNIAIVTALLFLWIMCYFALSHGVFMNMEEVFLETTNAPNIVIWKQNSEAKEMGAEYALLTTGGSILLAKQICL